MPTFFRDYFLYKIVHVEDSFIIVSKFPGVEFHGSNQLLSKLREDFSEVYGVHRLDKDTSGLMIFARSKPVQIELSSLFSTKKVFKTYYALSRLRPLKKQGSVKGDLIKARNGSYRISRTFSNPAITKFKSTYHEALSLRLFMLYPMTGKTHQLRVTMKSLSAPILGDSRYGGEKSDRMYLASYRLDFNLFDKQYTFTDDNFYGELLNSQMIDLIKGFSIKKGT